MPVGPVALERFGNNPFGVKLLILNARGTARTVLPLISVRGGRLTKAKRFSDDAQNFLDFPRCTGRRRATLLLTQPHTLLVGSAARAEASDTYRTLNLFGDVFERVRAAYVEKPDDSKLVESAINGMLAGIDPHSGYMNPHSFRDMQVQTRGEFGGLGIEVTMEDGLIKGRRSDRRHSGGQSRRHGQ
jgi:hypothetical protein